MMSCCDLYKGPGYSSPQEAIRSSPKETILYVTCINYQGTGPDFVATVDVNSESDTYSTILHRSFGEGVGDEFHHSGWNSCSSCFADGTKSRDKLVVPCLKSGNIYAFSVKEDPKKPKLFRIISGSELKESYNVSHPHTSHCLPTGEVLISCMGDGNGRGQGSFLRVDSSTFEVIGVWDQTAPLGYDFWYQLRHNLCISTEWADPRAFNRGFILEDYTSNMYGHSVHVWNLKERSLMQSLPLGEEGALPLEVRFLHNPSSRIAFVGCALSSNVMCIHEREKDDSSSTEWTSTKVIDVKPVSVSGWLMPSMPGIITDIIISMDDRFLYFSNWIQGDVRQYDISNPLKPELKNQLFLGGSFTEGSGVINDSSNQKDHPFPVPVPTVKNTPLRGGPQMLQLSLDGSRLYVTTSLYSEWDKQFYPEMVKQGGLMYLVDIDTSNLDNPKMKLNDSFLIDFGKESGGVSAGHEMRYPGGDCTSDIFP